MIISILQDIVSKINTDTFSFYYGEKGWQNLTADDAVFPMVSIDFISKVDLTLPKSGYIGENYPVSIYVGYKSELDWSTLQHETVIDKATSAARNIISQLQNYKDTNKNKLIDEVKFVGADRVILRPSDDVGTSGLLLKLIIIPAVDVPVCV